MAKNNVFDLLTHDLPLKLHLTTYLIFNILCPVIT